MLATDEARRIIAAHRSLPAMVNQYRESEASVRNLIDADKDQSARSFCNKMFDMAKFPSDDRVYRKR
ncbi:hypothetical protein MYU51_018315 [Penicillium brevicompactum]|uniref:uncharacterized protein n=1 Tax=Penicillium brevicompactum TaxID=5074 RepID=UPI002540AF2F|nr:uncharacterized protein N7506_007681 [Penicillium brevicompactum]KAJ5333898.1 hypothetical protein N7506_007681 [Penicillium brevicompactum]